MQDFLPDFAAAHPMPLLDAAIGPRIWIGNRLKVQTHFRSALQHRLRGGRKTQITLFPPEQVVNLYIGPLDFTPAGAPVSMVPLTNPDFARYPRFAEALRHASRPSSNRRRPLHSVWLVASRRVADAVQCAGELLVERRAQARLAVRGAAACRVSLRDLPADQRAMWKTMFELLVSRSGRGAGPPAPRQASLARPRHRSSACVKMQCPGVQPPLTARRRRFRFHRAGRSSAASGGCARPPCGDAAASSDCLRSGKFHTQRVGVRLRSRPHDLARPC